MTLMQFDGEVYSHKSYTDDDLIPNDGSNTKLEVFVNRYKKDPKKELYGVIKEEELVWYNSEKVMNDMKDLYFYLEDIIQPKDIIGIFSINRYEWMLSEHTIFSLGAIDCPLYSTFGKTAIKHVLNQTNMKICFLSGEKAINLYNDVLVEEKTELEHVIIFDSFDLKKEYEDKGIKVHFLSEILMNNISDLKDFVYKVLVNEKRNPKREDICTICYTSGTTGLPKGVILTHGNVITTVAAFQMSVDGHNFYEITEKEVYMSYLPLSHVMEKVCLNIILNLKGKIAFFRGTAKELANDYKIIKPTFVAGVPRVYNTFKTKFEEEVRKKGLIKQWLFKKALQYKYFLQRFGYYTSIVDTLIFNKVKEGFGGRIKAMLCGAAPVNPECIKFLQACLCCKIFQGYGQTETTAATIVAPMQETTVDTAGIAFPSNKIKLLKVSEEGEEEKYEILIKGKNVFQGYYKNEEATKECFIDDWFRSGDIGKVEKNLFKIVGRRKEIFKTSQGEYIVPEKIEDIYTWNEIDDILITGKSTEDYIVAIVVVTKDLSSDYIVNKIFEIGKTAVADNKIPRYEIPRKVLVRRNSFEEFGEVITPTGKKKRAFLEKCLMKEIDELYKN